jgi:DMSO/TMAO reductase YedYZ molybdopterin-dependent catalytic subunit
MSDFNDRAQAWLFNPNTLAREYPARMITRPFPFNSFYTPNSPDLAPRIDPREFVLNVTGLVERKDDWTLRQLYALPRFTQITRHVCIEGWSAIGKWTGVRFSDFLARVGADRHGDCAPSANAALLLDERRGVAPPARLPDEVARADEARVQEPQAHWRDRDRQ